MFLIMRYKIADKSMEPRFREGDYVVVSKLNYLLRKPKIKDVVVVKHEGRFLLKRINKTEKRKYIVQGDNRRFSSPVSISKEQILGKVLLHIRR